MLQGFGTNTQLLSVLPSLIPCKCAKNLLLFSFLNPELITMKYQVDYYHRQNYIEDFAGIDGLCYYSIIIALALN